MGLGRGWICCIQVSQYNSFIPEKIIVMKMACRQPGINYRGILEIDDVVIILLAPQEL